MNRLSKMCLVALFLVGGVALAAGWDGLPLPAVEVTAPTSGVTVCVHASAYVALDCDGAASFLPAPNSSGVTVTASTGFPILAGRLATYVRLKEGSPCVTLAGNAASTVCRVREMK